MAYFRFEWTDELIDHIAQHGVSQDDFEGVVCDPDDRDFSRTSGLPAAFGYAHDGRYIIAIYQELDEITVLPVTAYEVGEP
jgi:uncharacterized DUF497 family protein